MERNIIWIYVVLSGLPIFVSAWPETEIHANASSTIGLPVDNQISPLQKLENQYIDYFQKHDDSVEFEDGLRALRWGTMILLNAYMKDELKNVCRDAYAESRLTASLASPVEPPEVQSAELSTSKLIIRGKPAAWIDVLQCKTDRGEFNLMKGNRENSVYFVKLAPDDSPYANHYTFDETFENDIDLKTKFTRLADSLMYDIAQASDDW